MYSKVRPYINKLNFILGNSPKIERNENWINFIPSPYKAVITITADFELAWASRYSKRFSNALKSSLELAKKERENVPLILELCNQYDIPITWATVGHLFLESCERIDGRVHSKTENIKPFENEFWKFGGKDWFEHDPCCNYKEAPEWYAPDLIHLILASKSKHEIGCHTFSHIDCGEEVCSPSLFESEINACKIEAKKIGLELKTFVHPRHTIGNLDTLAALGFTSFQTDPPNILGYPVRHKNGLWEIKRTYELVHRKEWSIDYHLYRYKKIIDRAIRNNALCNFWFHPSVNKIFLDKIMPEILRYMSSLHNDILITTIGNYVERLNEKNTYEN